MVVNLLRIIIAAIFCTIAGRNLGKVTGGLSSGDRLQVQVAGILLVVAGLVLPGA